MMLNKDWEKGIVHLLEFTYNQALTRGGKAEAILLVTQIQASIKNGNCCLLEAAFVPGELPSRSLALPNEPRECELRSALL